MVEMELDKRCRLAIEILQKTHDGDELDPQHLWLVETAVNGGLNDKGWEAFQDLYNSALEGYHPPWFHGIENLIRRQGGYVYWKGQNVEHYDSPWCYSEEGKKAAEELARRCRHLEAIRVEVCTTNAIWHWEKWEGVKANENIEKTQTITG